MTKVIFKNVFLLLNNILNNIYIYIYIYIFTYLCFTYIYIFIIFIYVLHIYIYIYIYIYMYNMYIHICTDIYILRSEDGMVCLWLLLVYLLGIAATKKRYDS